ncbi:MAG: PAS domain S-box protein [Deltaproteobacteria bacterium]|nr:PAS domain S-box protein [Kofleriaceae bacterium]
MSGSFIAVVGGTPAERDRVVAALADHDLEAEAHERLQLDLVTNLPSLVIVVGADAPELCAAARAAPPLADVPILVLTTDQDRALAAGATDLAMPILTDAALARRVRNLQMLGRLRGPWTPGSLGPVLIKVNDILAEQGDDVEALIEVLELTRDSLAFDRASLVAHIEGSPNAFVVAATDDPARSQWTLAIADYPEIAEAIRTGEPVLLDDATAHPLTAPVADKILARGVKGVAVFPVTWRGRPLGAIILRKNTAGARHVVGRGAEFVRLISSLTAAHLRHGAVLESLRDQTHRISRLKYEAERRLRGIESLKEHFEAAADGVVIVDDGGAILFVNRAAERITGFARSTLNGHPMAELVAPASTEVLAGVVEKVLGGGNVEPFDLELATTASEHLTVSVSTSTVLADTGAVILTFRDVTAQRSLEGELRATKEFLERLIDSTVDAIVAADMRGTVILFNQGAERLYGYRADEVIGKLPVWELYDEGVPRQIMRMLRSTSHGGVGHLEQTRREIRAKNGQLVPVNMTASIIYENGREVATVGIFSDLRDRIRIEQRLLQAQEKLQITEKQALVAELAGAAAHELNQPLTSILGYAQLIQRQSPPEASHLRAVGVIREQAERMADIVKKIGRITKYETMPYVGGASILDLDRSTAGEVPITESTGQSSTSSTGDESVDGSRTREFSAIRPPPEMLAALELEELIDDPAAPDSETGSRPGEEKTRVVKPKR